MSVEATSTSVAIVSSVIVTVLVSAFIARSGSGSTRAVVRMRVAHVVKLGIYQLLIELRSVEVLEVEIAVQVVVKVGHGVEWMVDDEEEEQLNAGMIKRKTHTQRK